MARRSRILRSSRSIFSRVAVVLVVIAEQMQKSMDGEMGEMVVERLALGAASRATV